MNLKIYGINFKETFAAKDDWVAKTNFLLIYFFNVLLNPISSPSNWASALSRPMAE